MGIEPRYSSSLRFGLPTAAWHTPAPEATC